MEDKDLKLEKNIVLSSTVEAGVSKINNSKLSQLSNRLLLDNINKECKRRFETNIQEPPSYDNLCKNIKELLQKEAPSEIRDGIEVFISKENVNIDLGEVSMKIEARSTTNNSFTEEALNYLRFMRDVLQEEKQDGKQLVRIFQKRERRKKQLKKYHNKKGII